MTTLNQEYTKKLYSAIEFINNNLANPIKINADIIYECVDLVYAALQTA